MSLSARLAAIEKKAGDKEERPIVVVYEDDAIPEGTPPNALIVHVEYVKTAKADGR